MSTVRFLHQASEHLIQQKTLLIYGHYDVQPALYEDGWHYPCFELTQDPNGSGRMYGRGSTDDKGPIMAWLNVLEAHKAQGMALPVGVHSVLRDRPFFALRKLIHQVNLKVCFEGMEENGSEELDKFIESEKNGFFAGADCMCISGTLAMPLVFWPMLSLHVGAHNADNYWLDTKTPCLTYGLRGINYYEIRVSGPDRDLHSGVFGGTIHEPMTDLILLSRSNTCLFVRLHDCIADVDPVSKLVSPEGKILVPGVNDLIAPVTEDERKKFEAIHFGVADIHAAVGGDQTLTNDKVTTLMGRMRNPSLTLHGIEGAFCELPLPWVYIPGGDADLSKRRPVQRPSSLALSRGNSRSDWFPI